MALTGPLRVLCLFAGLAPLAAAAETSSLSAAERGRRIYERGLGADGVPLFATAGADRTQVPASFSACVNCHGADGRGRVEGGLTVPPITWDQLDKPYGATTRDGRWRAAYDEAAFHAALTGGVDPSGRHLASVMPRYSLAPADSADLAAYLRVIGTRAIPGVSDDTIRLGWRAPAGLPAQVTARVLAAWCAEVNASGGVFQRRLHPVALGEETGPVFTALSAGEDRSDAAAAVALARSGVPVLVAGRAPAPDHAPERWLFALFPADAPPAVAGEMPPQSAEDYLAFARRHALPAEEPDLQLAILASARVLLEALKNTGRDLDREKFLASLETLSAVETGFTPPAGFTSRHHIATPGAYATPPTLRARATEP